MLISCHVFTPNDNDPDEKNQAFNLYKQLPLSCIGLKFDMLYPVVCLVDPTLLSVLSYM